jgi:hypothetical protein
MVSPFFHYIHNENTIKVKAAVIISHNLKSRETGALDRPGLCALRRIREAAWTIDAGVRSG